MSLGPRPNLHTMATFAEIADWIADVQSGRWSWVRNPPCKYVEIKLDTRAGAYRIEDRDGNPISLSDLSRQHGMAPSPSQAPGGSHE